MGRKLTLCIVAILPATSIALAQSTSFWNHNGSTVKLEASGNARRFYYVEPRTGLAAKPGDLLFEGQRNGSRYIGTAYLFSEICGPIGYAVDGVVGNNDRMVTLTGTAPRRNAQCQVMAYFQDQLVFSFSENSAAVALGSNANSSILNQSPPAPNLPKDAFDPRQATANRIQQEQRAQEEAQAAARRDNAERSRLQMERAQEQQKIADEARNQRIREADERKQTLIAQQEAQAAAKRKSELEIEERRQAAFAEQMKQQQAARLLEQQAAADREANQKAEVARLMDDYQGSASRLKLFLLLIIFSQIFVLVHYYRKHSLVELFRSSWK